MNPFIHGAVLVSSVVLAFSQRSVRVPADSPGGQDSGSFLPDPHQKGKASSVELVEVHWGRLVDVHAVLPDGRFDPVPVFTDFVVSEVVQTDGTNYRLEAFPLIGKTRLVILRERGSGEFESLLASAANGLVPVVPKSELAAPPFSFVARNAVLVLRFDDLLDDGPAAQASLAEMVRIRTGAPPSVPFAARLRFDRNHGGLAGGVFHSTRVIVDLTVSENELADSPPMPVNLIGLPASELDSNGASVSIRIPTQLDPSSGQFTRLTNLAGNPLSFTGNGPNDPASPTADIVRAMRAGNVQDQNNGFLLDLEQPEVLGRFGIDVLDTMLHPHPEAPDDFLLRIRFEGPCQLRPRPGDQLVLGAAVLEVTRSGPLSNGTVRVRANLLTGGPLAAGSLLGSGLFVTRYRPGLALDPACWVTFTPEPRDAPAAKVASSASVGVFYSEPMLPESLHAYEALRVVRGDSSVTAEASNTAPGENLASDSAVVFVPLVPYPHVGSLADPYHVELHGGVPGPTDLAGNSLDQVPLGIDFTLDPDPLPGKTGGFVLRFVDSDEVQKGAADGQPDVRGQVFYDFTDGELQPRPVSFSSFPVDQTNGLPEAMVPFPLGVRTPLNPLGSKAQMVWRYADLGFNVRDETKYNLDVVGMHWSPLGGTVLADFFPEFEIRLAHSHQLPDERLNAFLLPRFGNSGLFDAPHTFDENILDDPASPQKVVHPRELGYAINPADVFVSSTGTTLIPYPLNQGAGPLETYTWRDTAIQAKAGDDGAGIPMDIEVGAPLFLDPGPAGSVAPSGAVPSIGLPLLMEFRCFPSDQALGLNALDISLAINSSPRPYFRVFSSGGVNSSGDPVTVDPDLALVPSGAFANGFPTDSADNVFSIGQLDVAIRISRAHTIWLDSGAVAPEYVGPVVSADLPDTTQVKVEFRGADGFAGAGDGPFDASALDAYGELEDGTVLFHGGISTWTSDITQLDGARFVQVRLTFVNDLESLARPTLDALAFAFVADPLSPLARRR